MRAVIVAAVVLAATAASADVHRRTKTADTYVPPVVTTVTIGDHGIPDGGDTPCLDPNRVEYLGAFGIPTCYDHSAQDPEASSFELASDHICFVPAEGGHPPSLYLGGFLQQGCPVRGGKFGRVEIPTALMRSAPEDLNLAPVIDSLHAFDGEAPRYIDNMCLSGWQVRPGDIFWLPALAGQTEPHLYMSVWTKYKTPDPLFNIPTFFTNTEGRDHLSHIWNIGPRQDHADLSDPWYMWKHCDFIFMVPPTFATANCPGKYLAIGNGNRDGGHLLSSNCPSWWSDCPETSPHACMGVFSDDGRIGVHLGPGFAMIDPLETVSNPADSTEITALEASGYYESGGGNSHHVEHDWKTPWEAEFGSPAVTEGAIDRFQDLDLFMEGAYICDTPFSEISEIFGRGNHAVVFVVQKATHQCDYSSNANCYNRGDACGKAGIAGFVCGHDDDGPPFPTVRPELWFFNPNDYANVLGGLADPWTPKAYAKIDLTSIFYQTRPDLCPTMDANLFIGGVAYDTENCVLYLEEGRAWTDWRFPQYPVVHVFKINKPPNP